jgi:hypothetical protein
MNLPILWFAPNDFVNFRLRFERKLMAIFFETPRFRVHITDTLAWIENREAAGWVLRGQVTIPVSPESLSAGDYPGMLAAAVLDFEESRPGDNSLRAALTGYRKSAIVRVLPRENPQRVRFPVARRVFQAQTAKRRWNRGPLRPPLAICPANRPQGE